MGGSVEAQPGFPAAWCAKSGKAAASLPALEERQLLLPLTVPGLPLREQVHVLGVGFLGEQGIDTDPGPPPRPGQHREEILRWLDGA
jgi:hypothetical protein